MRYRRLQTLGFAALLATITAIHCLPTEAQADRRRRWTTYGSDRGRLVVACDMTSDTCSDGRKITTTRATPVPCEVAPGVWEMVPENTACISYRGLESWAANTSYLSWGAELNRSPWGRDPPDTTVEALPRGYRITGTAGNSRVLQVVSSSIPGPHTLACVLRTDEPGTHTRLRIYWGGVSGPIIPVPVTSTWATYSITQTVPEDATQTSVHVYSGVGTVDVIGCWLTRADVPGRACWGGESPVTCAADRHTISTEGWPTEEGEIAVSFEVGALEGSARYIIDGRATGATTHSILLIESTGLLRLDLVAGTPNRGPLVPPGKHHIRIRVSDGRTKIRLNGMEVIDAEGTPTWHTEAVLGSRYTDVDPLNGSIRSLTVRSYEEVSP